MSTNKTIPIDYFIFNDESTINSYGFKILTQGISMNRFELNPIMLDQHTNSNTAVIGKWIDNKKVNGLLIGKPIFDIHDQNANNIKGKVERGFINSTSMGISFDKSDFLLLNGTLTLTKCELYEVSIVAVPSNASATAVRLYASNGRLMADDEIKTLSLSIKSNSQPPIPYTNHTQQFTPFTLSVKYQSDQVKATAKKMQIQDIEAMINNFSQELINDFQTTQQEFKALTLQKIFGLLSKRKIEPTAVIDREFWQRIQSNMELFRPVVNNEIDNVIQANFSTSQRVDYFFEYLDKNTKSE